MNHHHYNLSDGRYVLSPFPLTYAMGASGNIDLNKVNPEHTRHVNILASQEMDDLIRGSDKLDHNKPVCAIHDGEIHIKDGKAYKPLSTFLRTASLEELRYMLGAVAQQAAQDHLLLSQLMKKGNSL